MLSRNQETSTPLSRKHELKVTALPLNMLTLGTRSINNLPTEILRIITHTTQGAKLLTEMLLQRMN